MTDIVMLLRENADLDAANEIERLREQVEKLTEECVVLRASSRSKLETIANLEWQVEKLTKERFRDGWTHSCNALCMEIALWIERCPHCGMPAPKAPAMQEDKP